MKGPNFVRGIHAGKAEEGLLAAGMRGDPFGHVENLRAVDKPGGLAGGMAGDFCESVAR